MSTPADQSKEAAHKPARARRSLWAVLLPALALAVLAISGVPGSGAGLPTETIPGPPHTLSRGALPGAGWTERCEACHATADGFTHPVGVSPSMQIPPDLPLLNGRIACITCHDNGSADAHRQARQDGSALLRPSATGAGLCSQCHEPTSPFRRDLHANMLMRAHLRWPNGREGGAASKSHGPAGLFDPASETCLTCHDGSVAADVGHDRAGFAVGGTDRRTGLQGSHPVGVEYPRNGSVRRGPPLKPLDMLDERLRLYDNRVGCGTCHSLYSTGRGRLVMPNFRSELCLNCHDY